MPGARRVSEGKVLGNESVVIFEMKTNKNRKIGVAPCRICLCMKLSFLLETLDEPWEHVLGTTRESWVSEDAETAIDQWPRERAMINVCCCLAENVSRAQKSLTGHVQLST